MKIKDIIIFFICLNLVCTVIGSLGFTNTIETNVNMDAGVNTTIATGQQVLSNTSSGAKAQSEMSTWELITQSSGILSKIYSVLFGFPWLLDRIGGNVVAVRTLTGGLTTIMLFMYAYFIMSFFRGWSE